MCGYQYRHPAGKRMTGCLRQYGYRSGPSYRAHELSKGAKHCRSLPNRVFVHRLNGALYVYRRQMRPKPATIDLAQIATVKSKIHECNHERTTIQAKSSRMKQLIGVRDSKMKEVYKQPRSRQRLQTASDTTLKRLKASVARLERDLKTVGDELEEVESSDRTWRIKELRIQVCLMYAEQARCKKMRKDLKDRRADLDEKMEELESIIGSVHPYRVAMGDAKYEMSQLHEKMERYTHSRSKTRSLRAMLEVQNSPDTAKEIEQEVRDEIDMIKKTIEEEKQTEQEEIRLADEATDALEAIRDEAVARLTAAIQAHRK